MRASSIGRAYHLYNAERVSSSVEPAVRECAGIKERRAAAHREKLMYACRKSGGPESSDVINVLRHFGNIKLYPPPSFEVSRASQIIENHRRGIPMHRSGPGDNALLARNCAANGRLRASILENICPYLISPRRRIIPVIPRLSSFDRGDGINTRENLCFRWCWRSTA